MIVRLFVIAIVSIALLTVVGCGGKEEKVPEQIIEEPGIDTSAAAEPERVEQEPLFENPEFSKRGYTVQVYSFKEYPKAREGAVKFNNRGYKAYIEEVEVVGEGIYYRVRLGSYRTVAEAKRVGREVKARYGVDYWVDRD